MNLIPIFPPLLCSLSVCFSAVGLVLLLHVASIPLHPAQLWLIGVLLPSSADSVLSQLQHWWVFLRPMCVCVMGQTHFICVSAWLTVFLLLPLSLRAHIAWCLSAGPGPRRWAAEHESEPGSVLGQITMSNRHSLPKGVREEEEEGEKGHVKKKKRE